MTKITILDQTPVFGNQSGAQAVQRSVDFARHAESIGYDAYWVTEQHAMAAFACASPEILAAHLLAKTSKIRIGVAGILVGHYSSIKVAENVALLDVLSNGRFDFGIGRTPGAMPEVMQALGNEEFHPDVLDQKSNEIIAYLRNQSSLVAVPSSGNFDNYRILCGSMGGAARYAAENGLPLAYAMFVNPMHCQEAIDYYRSNFQPSEFLKSPKVSLAVNIIVGESDEAAFEMALPALHFFIRSRTDNYQGSFPTQQEAKDYQFNESQNQMMDSVINSSLIGSKETVEKKLRSLLTQTKSEELVVLSIVENEMQQLHSYKSVYNIFQKLNIQN